MIYAIALIAAYFGALVVFSIMARPYRAKLARLANELIADYPENQEMRELCESCARSAYSMRAAPIRFLGFVTVIIKPAREFDRECRIAARENPPMVQDRRVGEMLECHSASTAAANPIFGLLAYAARSVFILKAILYFRGQDQNREESHSLAELVELRAI